MPTIDIEGRKVAVDDSFLKLSPDEQNATVDEIASSFKTQEAPHKFGLGDTWPARLAKSIYGAVTLPGDVAQGNVSMMGEDGHTNPEVINRAADLASVASPMSPAARSGIGWAGALKTEQGPAPTEQALGTATDAGYDAARNSGFELKSDAVRNWAAQTQADLEAKGRLKEFAPDTHAVLTKLQSGDPAAIATGGNLVSAREALREASRNFINPREKAAAEIAIRKLDGFVENPPAEAVLAGDAPSFAKTAADARGNAAAEFRSKLLSDALQYADQKAAKNNSGANVGNAERDRLFNIYQSDKKSAGFSPDELAQTDQIIRGTPLANITRAAGNYLGGGGGLGAHIASGTGAAAGAFAGGPAGAVIGAIGAPAVGYGLKKFSDSIGKREINRLQEMVRKRSPLGDSMPDRVVGKVSPRQALTVRALLMGSHPLQNDN